MTGKPAGNPEVSGAPEPMTGLTNAGRTGTWTFLFTDIEGSTRLVQALGDHYPALLARHRELLAAAIEDAGGHVFGSEGDALFSAFPTAGAAIAAAAAAQRRLAAEDWPVEAPVRVRMGIHSGEALSIEGDYVGLALHQAARIMSAGHGGQILVSAATRALAAPLPIGLELRDLGERRLKDLAAPERLYQVAGEGLAERFPALRTLDTRPNNLPTQVTSFVGRQELVAARAALANTRLLSLTGPGGTGKTRLAVQLAGEASDAFPDGVFFVNLDAVQEPALVPAVIASTLGLATPADPLDALVAHLASKRLLLVLDNFEQVVGAATDVARLLRDAPELKIIVTTRIVLRIYGEHEFPVPPLGLPPSDAKSFTLEEAAGYEAIQLFVERARAVQPAFALTAENAGTVVNIVRRLDGLPLAIELAAARARVLPLSAIQSRLDQHLSLLTGGSRDLPERQQTLRGAIDWSYDLLETPDRRLFQRFAIHAGGAFLSQADAICGPPAELGEDVLDGLSSLADKSLVKARLDGFDDPRFAMLVTIRDYAHERLVATEEFEELARRHAETYLAVVEDAAPHLTGPDAGRLSDRLEVDHDNLRAAIEWSIARKDVRYALRFVTAVWRFWQTRGHLTEARARIDTVLSLPGLDDQPPDVLAPAYEAAGGITYWQGDTPATHRLYKRALEVARRSGDQRLIARALYNYSFAALETYTLADEGYAAGIPYVEEALRLFTELGDEQGIADASWALAIAIGAAGHDRRQAVRYAQEALDRYRALGDPFGTAWACYMVASLQLDELGPEAVAPYFTEALRLFATAHDRSGILLMLAVFAVLAARRGKTERVNRLGGAIERLRRETGAGLLETPVRFVDYGPPDKPTDPAGLEQWAGGAKLSTEEAIAYALSDE